jgi:galactokinase
MPSQNVPPPEPGITVGMSPDLALERFRARFGFDATLLAVAPGRVNLIGEHTDYHDGFVFPAAIDRVTYVAAAVTDGPTTLISTSMGEAEPFDIESVSPGDVQDWGRYVAAVGWSERRFGRVPNLVASVDSNVPAGSGVSSSAALELAFGVLYNELAGLNRSLPELALDSQYAENEFVGNKCGIMDQMASACGRADQAMFLDTRSLEIAYGPLPGDLALVLLDTKVPRRADDWRIYRRRRYAGEYAAKVMGIPASKDGTSKLREATLEQLDFYEDVLTEVNYRRARHVISENQRCIDFRLALEAGDLESIGRLMRASHESLRDDYEVTSPELDAMAEAAWASPGCVGARMTGAGFGGACIALVSTGDLSDFQSQCAQVYLKLTGIEPEIHICRAENGACILFH